MNYDKLLDVLKKQDCFCLWKIEHRNGKKTKVPYQINGARARPNDLETFSSFADVMAVYLKGGYRYNEIYKVQIPNITPHVCRHMYCSNQAKAGMNPKTLQYLMGHSDIGVTMNVYTHLGLEDAEEELRKMEDFRKAQEAIEKKEEKPVTQKAFKVV